MHKRTIVVKFSYDLPDIEMIIPIPFEVDTEEYIDKLLEAILDDKFKYGAEWDFSDGISG